MNEIDLTTQLMIKAMSGVVKGLISIGDKVAISKEFDEDLPPPAVLRPSGRAGNVGWTGALPEVLNVDSSLVSLL